MDINKGLQYSGNKDELYRKTLTDFYRDSKRRQELVRSLATEDIARYKFEVHALKGIARNIGADHLADMAYLHESAVTEDDPEYIDKHLQTLMDLWNQTLREIEAYVGRAALAEELDGTASGAELSETELKEIAATCIGHLNAYEEDAAATLLKEALTHSMAQEMHDLLTEIYHEVDDFEYEKAIKMLQTI